MTTKENARWQAGAEASCATNDSSKPTYRGSWCGSVTNVEFLEALFLDLPDGSAAMTCGFAGDPHNASRGDWFARPWTFGDGLNLSARSNNYVAVGSFLPDPTLGQYRRRKANFARLHAVMLDDLGTKLPLSRAARMKPSALVETSPGNYQAWLFLHPCAITDSREQSECLIQAMIRQGLAAAADPGMAGVTRYGRLPVGINGKAKYLCDGQPFTVRLAEWSPQTRYAVAAVAHAFALDLTPPASVAPRCVASVGVGQAYRRIDDFAALVEVLSAAGYYQAAIGEGRHAITCPWVNEHTDADPTGTAIFEPNGSNGWVGGFRCHHSHGERLHIGHVYRFVRDLTRGAA